MLEDRWGTEGEKGQSFTLREREGVACGLGVCEGKETRGPNEVLEKQNLCIGSAAEETGRWVSHSTGSLLKGGGGALGGGSGADGLI